MADTAPEMTNTTTPKKGGSPMGMIAVGLIVLVAIGAIGYKMSMNSSSSSQTPTAMTDDSTSTGDATATSTPTTIQAASYKDGSYNAQGAYISPAGPETIEVKLTLKDNVVTDAEVVSDATVARSKMMQGAFIGGYKEFVIGKNINDIHLDKVSGSSLTPKGFNDALEKIKSQAQSV